MTATTASCKQCHATGKVTLTTEQRLLRIRGADLEENFVAEHEPRVCLSESNQAL